MSPTSYQTAPPRVDGKVILGTTAPNANRPVTILVLELPNGELAGMLVLSHLLILGNEVPTHLNCSCVNQSVGRIPRERGRK